MTKYFSRQLLYRIRNEIPLAALLPQLQWPHKIRDGRLCRPVPELLVRTYCPVCGGTMRATGRKSLPRCARARYNRAAWKRPN